MTTLRTNGWDLVAAIRQGCLNEQFASLYRQGKLIQEIKEVVQFPFVGDVTVDAKVGPPTAKIDTATVNFVQVTFPLTGGSISSKLFKIPIPTQGLTIIVVTNLTYVHLQFKDDSKVLRVAVDFTSADAVYNVDMQGAPPDWNPDYNDVLASALKKLLREEAAAHDYDHPYHLGDVVLPKDFPQGLEPSGESDFATQLPDRTPAGDNNIVLLAMATAGDPAGKSGDFTNLPWVVPDGHVSSLIISNETLIKKLVVPAVASGIGCSASDFAISGGGTTPATASLKTHPYIGGDYSVYIWNTTINVADNNSLYTTYEAHAHPLVDTKEVFYIKVTGNMSLAPQIKLDKQGNQVITFAGSASDPQGSIECEWWVYVIVVAAIILSFGTLSLAFAMIAAVVVGVLMGTLAFPVDLPSELKTLIEQGLASFNWPLQQQYPLDGVSLPGDLIITGVPKL